MQRIYLLLLCCLSITWGHAQSREQYTSIEEQAEAIKTYYEKTISSTKEERAQYEQLFFEAFPSLFQTFKAFYFPRWKGGEGLN